MSYVASTLLESLSELFFAYLTGGSLGTGGERRASKKCQWESVSGNKPTGRTRHSSHENIPQLPDIAWPGVMMEGLYNLRREFCVRAPFSVKQMADEQGKIL